MSKIRSTLASPHYLHVIVHPFLQFVQKGAQKRGEDTWEKNVSFGTLLKTDGATRS
jgi:hypothetical protein